MAHSHSKREVQLHILCQRKSWEWVLLMFKVSVYFWLIFKMKRKQEIAVENMLMNQEVLVVLLTAYGKSYYKRMWLHAGNETTQRNLPVYQHYQRADCQERISHLHVPTNLSCQSSYFRWKLVGLFFLQFLWWKWKICRDQRRLTCLASMPHDLFCNVSICLAEKYMNVSCVTDYCPCCSNSI